MVCECAFRKELERAIEREANIDHTEKLLNEIVAKIEEVHEILSVERDYYAHSMRNLMHGKESIKKAMETLRKERRRKWRSCCVHNAKVGEA